MNMWIVKAPFEPRAIARNIACGKRDANRKAAAMLLHCVFCKFRLDADASAQTEVIEALATFARSLEDIMSFDHGPNVDFEGKSPDYKAGFVIRFADQAALSCYANHPMHQVLGRQLCDLCEGVAEGIVVYDLATS